MAILTFSSDNLPAELDDRERFAKWVELFSDRYRAYDQYRFADEKFSAKFTQLTINSAGVARMGGSVARAIRTRSHLAADPRPTVTIGFVRGADMMFRRSSGETLGSRGVAVVLAKDAPQEVHAQANPFDIATARVPLAKLQQLVGFPEDFDLQTLDPERPVVGLLNRYVDIVLADSRVADEPMLAGHVEQTLVDLIALALGAPRDAQEMVRGRGLRAARLQEICAAIKTSFADPAFSPHNLAGSIGVSPNYIQKLLHESGVTFTERVLELRLQKARLMLCDRRHDRLKVSEIALACGFGEVTNFNRCFRRRFGLSPTLCRGGAHR
jgi:AraC-like DNA-binding protein